MCLVVVVVSVAYLCEFFGCHEAVCILNLGGLAVLLLLPFR